jgi:hypothetical protein
MFLFRNEQSELNRMQKEVALARSLHFAELPRAPGRVYVHAARLLMMVASELPTNVRHPGIPAGRILIGGQAQCGLCCPGRQSSVG